MVLNRESISNGLIEKIAEEAQAKGLFTPLTPEERRASLERILDTRQNGEPVWVFGYGSLMWNPAFHVAETRRVRLSGYHRRFCLWTPLGRGTPERPGLVLGLDRGGSCRGAALRVPEEALREELTLVWRREMVSGAYLARWVPVQDRDGRRFRAIAFVINRAHDRYAGNLSLDSAATAIAHATGTLGPCREYLENTVAHLDADGIPDRRLTRLLAAVHRELAASSGADPA